MLGGDWVDVGFVSVLALATCFSAASSKQAQHTKPFLANEHDVYYLTTCTAADGQTQSKPMTAPDGSPSLYTCSNMVKGKNNLHVKIETHHKHGDVISDLTATETKPGIFYINSLMIDNHRKNILGNDQALGLLADLGREISAGGTPPPTF